MKKVLFTATVDSHILQFHLSFLKLFKEKGYEVHVATNGNEEIPYCDVKHIVSFERSPFKLNNLKAIKQLKKICNEEKFDIIHTHTPMGSVVTRLAAKNARKKYKTRVIYTAHGLHFFKGAPIINWLLFYPVEKYLSKYTDTLILINMEDYERCKKHFKKCKDIQYVPGVGIDEDKFNFEMTKKEKKEFRESLGLKEDDFVMIFPAELNKNKNQLMIINAMEELSKKYSDMKVLLPGVDSYNGYYQNLVKEKGLEDYIKFLGYRKDIPKLLKISNLALAASYREGLPLNVMEAMYVGLPIVATDCRGQRELVKNNINGYLIEINNQELFNKSIEKIYLSKDESKEYGKQSKKVIKDYLLDNILERICKIYFKKKRILHLLASNKYSGAENVVCTIIDNTSNDYEMAYCSPEGPIRETLNNRNIKYYGITKLKKSNIKKIIDDFKPDIIHAHDFKASFIASRFNNQYKVISHLHKNDPDMTKLTIKSILYLIISKKINKIVGVSDSILNEYIFKESIKDKYITLFNYVDKERVLKLADKFKVKENYDLFYFGRLSDEKNPIEFIEIVKELNNKEIKCVMIGDGPLREQCENLIKKYSLEDNIKMIGFQSNPFPYIKASKIGIMPSKFEGFGLAAIEALILNKPVLNSGVGGLGEIFKSNSNLICISRNEYKEEIDNILINKRNTISNNEMYTNVKEWQSILNNLY